MKKSKMTDSDMEIYQDFALCGQNAKKWMNKCVMMLPEVDRRRIWEKKGFSCIYEFAAKLAGMSRDKVNEGLRVLARTEGLEELRKVIEKKGIWAVRPVLRVANEENQKFWAEKAKTMSKGVLETYVRDTVNFEKSGEASNGRPRTVKNDGAPVGKPNQLSKIKIKVSEGTAKKLMEVKGDDSWEDLMKELIDLRRQKEHERKNELVRIRAEIEREKRMNKPVSRYIPSQIQRYIKLRSRGKCEAPECRREGREMHHTYPFALKREHDPDKIRLLCEEHHKIVHQGLIDDAGPPERWKWLKKLDILDFRSAINQRVLAHNRIQ